MPRASKQPPLHEQKPYSRPTSVTVKSEDEELLTDVKPNVKGKTASGKPKARPWTATELLALFDTVGIPAPNAKAFEGRIAGRSGYQCQQTWR